MISPFFLSLVFFCYNSAVEKGNTEMENYKLPDHRAEQKRTRQPENILRETFSMPQEALHLGKGKQYCIHTFGCQANVRDSETMAGMLEAMGFTATENDRDADVVIFNTCAIRKAAEDHALGQIGEFKSLKKEHPERIIALCGCMAQEDEAVDRIIRTYPQIDLVFGTHNINVLPSFLVRMYKDHNRIVEVESIEGEVIEDLPVSRSTGCKGFVNIMYGCNKFCTYCIVPYTRGVERSRMPEQILKEIRQMISEGRKEVILLGQNVNAYGKDLGMEDGFASLLAQVAETGIPRIRFYTSHPRDYSASVIDVMHRYPNIMKSLHLPVQSGSNDVLKRMARGYTAEQYRDLFDALKKSIPEITFTTDLIVGFPSETDEQFQMTLDLVDYCRFDLAYTFIYSPRQKTPAAAMDDNVPMSIKNERLQELNRRITHYARQNNEAFLHKTVKVLCEGPSKKNPEVLCGYSEENKLVNFTGENVTEGDIVSVYIDTVRSFSLDGHVQTD